MNPIENHYSAPSPLLEKPIVIKCTNPSSTSAIDPTVLEKVTSAIKPQSLPQPLSKSNPPIPNICYSGEDINKLYLQMQIEKEEILTLPELVYDSKGVLLEPFFPKENEVAILPPRIAEATQLSLIRSLICNDQFIALIKKMPCLDRVTLLSCSFLTGKGLMQISQLKLLRHLNLNLLITEKEFSQLVNSSSWEQLEVLEVSHTFIDDQTLALFPNKYPNLKVLDLSFCPNLTDQSVLALVHLKKLTQVDLRGTSISLRGIEYLKSVKPKINPVISEDREEKDLAPQIYFIFIHRFLLGKGIKHEWNNWEVADWIPVELETEISSYYHQELKQKKIPIDFEMSREMWLEADFTLQSEAALKNLKTLIRILIKKVNWNRLGMKPTADPQHWAFFLSLKLPLFTDIVELDLSGLNLDYFPQILAQALFTKLKRLILSGNQIEIFPPLFFCNAPQLEEFDCKKNRIQTLPPDFLDFWPHIKTVDLRDNPLAQGCLHNPPQSLEHIFLGSPPASEKL